MKRDREDGDEEGAVGSGQKRARGSDVKVEGDPSPDLEPRGRSVTPGTDNEGTQGEEDDQDGRIALPKSTSRAAVRKGIECPYLDTVSRQVGLPIPCTEQLAIIMKSLLH